MSQFYVRASTLRGAADELERQILMFSDATKQIKIAAETLSTQWEGDAATAFQVEQVRQQQWFQAAVNVVKDMELALRTIANRYQDTDHDAAKKLKGLT